MKVGLVGRILVAGAVVLALMLAELGVFISSVESLRVAADDERRADVGVQAVSRYETLILDLQTGERGFALSGRRESLEPWTRAERQLPAAERALVDSTAGTPQEPDARTVVREGRAYLREWSRPVVRLALHDPEAARARSASGEESRRVAAIRRDLAGLARANADRADRARDVVDARERRGLVAGVGGIVLAVALFAAIVGYFLRSAISPLRRVAEATKRIAGGELETRVPEGGAGEVAELARSFNAMAASLQGSRGELQQQVNVTRTVLDSTVDGICLTDAVGNVLLANRPLLRFVEELGLPVEGTAQERLLAAADRFTQPELYRRAIGRITPELSEATVDEFQLSESGRCFQGFTTPVLDEAGRLAGRVWTLREVTAERVADRAKDEFVASVSHELRTPLTSIVGFLELLLAEDVGAVNREQREFLEIALRSAQRLVQQVGDLLFVSQLESGGLVLRPERVDLVEVARDAADQAAGVARREQVQLSVVTDGAVPVSCDRERIAQVVGNLLSNALKFTPAGGRVTLRARTEGDAAVVEVEDTGIGVPERERPHLFERFFRSSRSVEHAIQGTGLGLAISKAIVDAHGGSISAADAPSGGMRFRVELPLERAPAGAAAHR